ncbi:hypothetical protein SLA2020_031560 [Shorea laevis]
MPSFEFATLCTLIIQAQMDPGNLHQISASNHNHLAGNCLKMYLELLTVSPFGPWGMQVLLGAALALHEEMMAHWHEMMA